VAIVRIIAPVTAAAIYLGMAAGALAQDHAVIFAGGTYDSASYGDVGMQVALPGSVAGRGFAIRGSAFLGGYGYNDGSGQHVDATFGGGELDGVYAFSGAWGSADVFAGVRDVDTRLSPSDVGNPRLGNKAEFAVGTDGDRVFGPWRTDWYGAYGTDLRDYQTRASLTHRFGPVWRLGAEGAVEGDPTYTLERVGPYAGFRLSAHSEIQGSVGVSHQSGLGEHAYARISWYRSF
jgi:hypothetical protein